MLAINPTFLGRWLPLIFGVLSFILFYLIIGLYNTEVRGISALFLLFSPAYIYLFSTPVKYGLVTFMLLLGIYLKLKGKKRRAAIIIFGLTGLFSIITLIALLICYLFNSVKTKRWEEFITLILFLIITFLLQFYKILFIPLPEVIFTLGERTIITLFNLTLSDFGGISGISIFTFIVALIGIYRYWEDKYKFLIVYLITALLMWLALYFNFLILYFNFLIVFLAGMGLKELLEHKWRSDVFRHFTILFIICGIAFSGLTFLNQVDDLEPSEGFSEAMTFLKNQDSQNTVFSHYSRGSYIAYARKTNFMDETPFYARNVHARLIDSNKLLHAQNLKTATSIINKHNIQYIWLDKKLIEQIWGRNEIELIFLLKYSPNNFKKIFDNEDVEMYEYVKISGNYTT